MPRLDAMSRAREGEDSRARALSLEAATAEVIAGFFGDGVSLVTASTSPTCSLDGISEAS